MFDLIIVARHDSVIVGRGGYLLIPRSFKVRIQGSKDQRVQRFAEKNGLAEAEARSQLEQRDASRLEFLREVALTTGDDPETILTESHFDLLLDSDGKTPEQLAAQIASSVPTRGGR